jgi:hypothetical protein
MTRQDAATEALAPDLAYEFAFIDGYREWQDVPESLKFAYLRYARGAVDVIRKARKSG